jgi:hypothetical protein
MVIGVLLGVGSGVGIPERLVLGQGADMRAGLCQLGGWRSSGERGLALERALDGGVGIDLRLQQARAHRLDVGAGVVAGEVGQPIDGALTGASAAGA